MLGLGNLKIYVSRRETLVRGYIFYIRKTGGIATKMPAKCTCNCLSCEVTRLTDSADKVNNSG